MLASYNYPLNRHLLRMYLLELFSGYCYSESNEIYFLLIFHGKHEKCSLLRKNPIYFN